MLMEFTGFTLVTHHPEPAGLIERVHGLVGDKVKEQDGL